MREFDPLTVQDVPPVAIHQQVRLYVTLGELNHLRSIGKQQLRDIREPQYDVIMYDLLMRDRSNQFDPTSRESVQAFQRRAEACTHFYAFSSHSETLHRNIDLCPLCFSQRRSDANIWIHPKELWNDTNPHNSL